MSTLKFGPTALFISLLALSLLACAGAPDEPKQPKQPQHAHGHDQEKPMPADGKFAIPEAMKIEHEMIHGALVQATKAPGKTGEAARELAAILHPHFVREEQIALPPLSLLAPLARGETDPSMREILPLTDALRAEIAEMLHQHEGIGAAAKKLEETARAEGNKDVEQTAIKLQLHARTEEQVTYPAAILVGDLVRDRVK